MVTDRDARELTKLLSERKMTPDKIVTFARVYARMARDVEYKELYERILAITDALKAMDGEGISAMLNGMADGGASEGRPLSARKDDACDCKHIESLATHFFSDVSGSMSVPFCLSAGPESASGFELSELHASGDMREYSFEIVNFDQSFHQKITSILGYAPDTCEERNGRVCSYAIDMNNLWNKLIIDIKSLYVTLSARIAEDSLSYEGRPTYGSCPSNGDSVELLALDENGRIAAYSRATQSEDIWCAKLTLPNPGKYRLEVYRKTGRRRPV